MTASDPVMIGLDWGTSSLRAYLLGADGRLLDRRATGHGIQHLPAGGYAAAFRGVVGDWLDRCPSLPIVAAGMVGSRSGWHEVPYVACPANPHSLAQGLVAFDSGSGTIHLVPGLSHVGPVPDVMRGEEMQIIGALILEPDLAAASLCVLPGTHCKWAMIDDGRVTRFTTYLTGELFALLRDHSIVGRPAKEAGLVAQPGIFDREAFAKGVQAARQSGASGVASRLFSTRSLFLTGELTATQTLDYLSGLLIGEEIRSVLADLRATARPPLVLLGDPVLCDRYRLALATFGIDRVQVLNETGPLGLWQIALAAGLVARSPHNFKMSVSHG
jgi:2-dehydro-3-deoxygalactonokinase